MEVALIKTPMGDSEGPLWESTLPGGPSAVSGPPGHLRAPRPPGSPVAAQALGILAPGSPHHGFRCGVTFVTELPMLPSSAVREGGSEALPTIGRVTAHRPESTRWGLARGGRR